MCSRYLTPEGTEIRPGDVAAVHTADGEMAMHWGFPLASGRLIINARSETAADKPFFRRAMLQGRCIIEAAAFFEWDQHKRRHIYRSGQREKLYLAALYTLCDDGKQHFTVLTQEAKGDAQKVHPRMPCFLPTSEYRHLWLHSDTLSPALLMESELLEVEPVPQETEQTRLPL